MFQFVSISCCNKIIVICFGSFLFDAELTTESMKNNENRAEHSSSPSMVCAEVSYFLLDLKVRFGWFLRTERVFTYGVGYVQCKTASETKKGIYTGKSISLWAINTTRCESLFCCGCSAYSTMYVVFYKFNY